MSYETFVSAIKQEVEKMVGRDMRVELHTAIKNNGKERVGLALKKDDINISPAIYLDEYYKMWQETQSLHEVALDILRLYEKVCVKKSWDSSAYHDYDRMKPRLAYKLINFEKNEGLLRDTPHIKYLDFAIVFYVLVDISSYGTSTMLIRNEHKEMWKINLEQLYEDALANTEQLLPPSFETMSSVIDELLEGESCRNIEDECLRNLVDERMFVLSNKKRSFGAASILYKGNLKAIGKILSENFYVLPSSVHEVIIVPCSKAPARNEMDEMVREINLTQVLPEEVLSDHCYYYETKKEMLLY